MEMDKHAHLGLRLLRYLPKKKDELDHSESTMASKGNAPKYILNLQLRVSEPVSYCLCNLLKPLIPYISPAPKLANFHGECGLCSRIQGDKAA